MKENILRMNELRKCREENINKLTKLLRLLVKTEWSIISSASEKEDNISKLAAKSISEASSCIQTAISQMISTETNHKIKEQSLKKVDKAEATIRSLKKVLVNKKQ